MDVDEQVDELIEREGGYVNHPADKGGPTRYGITEAVARAHGYAGAMAELFDTGANMGPAVAATFLQRALTALNRGGKDYPDLTPDGRVGPVTIAALDAFLAARGANSGETVLLRALEALQGERYLRLAETRPANEAFLYGWLANRMGESGSSE